MGSTITELAWLVPAYGNMHLDQKGSMGNSQGVALENRQPVIPAKARTGTHMLDRMLVPPLPHRKATHTHTHTHTHTQLWLLIRYYPYPVSLASTSQPPSSKSLARCKVRPNPDTHA